MMTNAEPVNAKAGSSNKEENQCQGDKTELLTALHVKGELVTLPLDGKVPATLPNQNFPHKWGVDAPMLKNSDIEKHIKSKGEKGNLGIVLRGQHIVIDGDMKWYPDWKGQDGGVYDRDNSGKYKIKRFNPPDKDGKPAKGIKSDYCVDMMAFMLDEWGLRDVGTGTETSGGGRHIHILAPKGVNTKKLKKHLPEFKFKNEEGEEGNALEFLREGNYVLTVGVTEYDDSSKRYHTLPNGIDPLDKDNMPEATQVMIDALSQSRNPESKAPIHPNANGTHAVSNAFSNLDDPNSVELTAEQINSIKINTYPQKTPEQVRLILEKVKGWDEYDKWIDVGLAVKHWANESDGDMDAEAFALFDEWSRQSKTKYSEADCRNKWKGFKPRDSNPITLGSLIAEIEGDGDCTPYEMAIIKRTKHTDSDRINVFPELGETPCYRVYDSPIYSGKENLRAGTYHHYRYVDRKTGELGDEVLSQWICTPLYIDSVTHDKNSNNFGVFLRFKPTVGSMRQWCMPMAMLSGLGEDFKKELLGMGLRFDVRDNKKSLIEYINNQTPNKTIEISTQTGWYKDAFILPDSCIGSDKYYFQNESLNTNIHYQQQGALEEWQTNVAKYCIGNPLLMLSVCTAFMGALLKPTHQKGGGFHIYGDSSKGKSTGMVMACSVFGDEAFQRSWKTTSNGLEGASAMANDSLLALDEISESNPKEIGAVVYALANGVGKQRANRNGGARDVARWRVAVLSNGERSIESAMLEAGKKAKAGQSIRLLNIPLFGEHGAFNELHGKEDGRALSDHLQAASIKYYGVAGIEYLTKLVAETRDLDKEFNNITNELIGDEELSAQEARGAKRFALAAMAGELATDYGITGWEAGKASSGVKECFNQWRADFGKGDNEDVQCLKAVKDFIDKHGDSRFSLANGEDKYIIHNRAGYYLMEDAPANAKDTKCYSVVEYKPRTTYLFNDAGMEEAAKDNGKKRTIAALVKHGWLETQGVRNKKEQRINGTKSRFYSVTLPDEA